MSHHAFVLASRRLRFEGGGQSFTVHAEPGHWLVELYEDAVDFHHERFRTARLSSSRNSLMAVKGLSTFEPRTGDRLHYIHLPEVRDFKFREARPLQRVVRIVGHKRGVKWDDPVVRV